GVHSVIQGKKAEAGRPVSFAVILKNQGNVRDAINLTVQAPEGWTTSVRDPTRLRTDVNGIKPTDPVAAGTGRVVFATVTPPTGTAAGEYPVTFTARSQYAGTATASTQVGVSVGQLGAQVARGDSVSANYAGLLPDGRLFDTSIAAVANNNAQPKFLNTGSDGRPTGFQAHPYGPFSFDVGGNVIEGFTDLALTARVGETVVGYIPQERAYAARTSDQYTRPLTGHDLIFELEILSAS
ncbi:MAG TPA: NEW3 domain-containing protein, partial [Candidatus Thermoplasmatota archaeon]|nr:NEW3 domain-containing protein [Candidatus Thermoplasmatota archaeon]